MQPLNLPKPCCLILYIGSQHETFFSNASLDMHANLKEKIQAPKNQELTPPFF